MKLVFSPGSLRIIGILLFGTLMAARAEVSTHWLRDVLAGGAFGVMGLVWRLPRRPVSLSLRFFRLKRCPER